MATIKEKPTKTKRRISELKEAKKSENSLWPLTIFLAKETITETQFLDQTDKPKKKSISIGGKVIGTLYYKASFKKEPRWLDFFESSVDKEEMGIFNAHSSAALIVTVDDRLFAVTFGFGRTLLCPAAYETRFGLKVALNCIDPKVIRCIDRQIFEGVTRNVREQVSLRSGIEEFGLDVEKDMLRAVVGSPRDSAFGTQLSGIDALFATVRTDLKGLPDLLKQYYDKSQDDSYKKDFPWVDNISEERDKEKIEELQNKLVGEINSSNFERKWLAPPDLLDWNDFGGFRFGKDDRRELLSELTFQSYFDYARDPDELTLERLKSTHVSLISESTSVEKRKWPLFKCIYAELEDGETTYILNNGCWYKIDNDFVGSVNADVDNIMESACPRLPCPATIHEEEYNKKLAKHIPGAACMDRKTISHGGGRSSIEFCDVITPNKQLIHVKPYSGSGTLSHLFSQGVVSGELFVQDAEFRKKLNKILPKEFKLEKPLIRPRATEYEVAYFIISEESETALTLPFFSRITIRNAKRRLEAFGFKVTLSKVQRES
jgi:uncharacterized protein (TIGR04141 family)